MVSSYDQTTEKVNEYQINEYYMLSIHRNPVIIGTYMEHIRICVNVL